MDGLLGGWRERRKPTARYRQAFIYEVTRETGIWCRLREGIIQPVLKAVAPLCLFGCRQKLTKAFRRLMVGRDTGG